MCKKSILKEINSSLNYNKRAWDMLYKGKVYAVSSSSKTIDSFFKTKRGAEGYIKRKSNVSYYDEMTFEMVNCGSGKEVIEILESELKDYRNDKMIWYKELYSLLGYGYNELQLQHEAKKYLADNDELRNYVLSTIEEMRSENWRSIKVYRTIESIIENIEEKQESLNEFVKANQNGYYDREIEYIKEDIENLIKDLKEDFNFDYNSTQETELVQEQKENTTLNNFKNNLEININLNEEKEGIEISFVTKPEKKILDNLKAQGFRWHRVKTVWYAKQTEERMQFVNSLIPQKEKSQDTEEAQEIETIENNIEVETREKITEVKPTKETIEIIDISSKDIFIKALSPALNKNSNKSENDEEINIKSYLQNYKITEVIKMTKEQYNYFSNHLLRDYNFLQHKGGWEEDENGNLLHYCAIAIICENEEILIVDPSGCTYARYLNKLVEGEELIINSISSTEEINIKVDNKKYNNSYDLINDNDLYIINSSYDEILKDDRIILSQYLNDLKLVTGKTLKEFIEENRSIDIINIEKCNYSIEILEEALYKSDNGLITLLFPNSKEIELSKVSMLKRLYNELERAKKAA